MISVRCLKWYGLLKSEFPDTSNSLSARSPLGGFSLSIMTPGRLGELGRPLFLPATSRSGAFVLNCVDRSLDFWGLVTVALLAFPWILLASGIPVTVAGFGLQEGAAMTVLSSQGVASEVAINAALLIFIVSTVLPGAVGALLVLRSSLRRSDNS